MKLILTRTVLRLPPAGELLTLILMVLEKNENDKLGLVEGLELRFS